MPTKLNSAGKEYDHYWPEDVPWTEAWRHHPDLLPDHSVDGFKTGDIVVWPMEYETPSVIYWIGTGSFRLSCVDNPDVEASRRNFLRPFSSSSGLFDRNNCYNLPSIIRLRRAPAADNNPATPPPFQWPTRELAVLVERFPRAETTRAILRRVYGTPPPGEAVTPEALAEWAATQKVWTPPTPIATPSPARRNTDVRTIRVAGSIDGHTYGSCSYTESWTVRGHVDVPLSVFEEGEDAVRNYVEEEFRDNGDRNYGEYEYADHESDNDEVNDIYIDVADAMEVYEQLTAEEEEEEEEED
jgi:hypothetical protein